MGPTKQMNELQSTTPSATATDRHSSASSATRGELGSPDAHRCRCCGAVRRVGRCAPVVRAPNLLRGGRVHGTTRVGAHRRAMGPAR